MSFRLVLWERASAGINHAARELHAAVRGLGPRSVYGLSGGLSLALGAFFTLWVLLPTPPADFPGEPREAWFTCRLTQGAEDHPQPIQSALGSLPPAPCGPTEYTVVLQPDPIGEDVHVDVVTNRPRSKRTQYTVDWPGRVRVMSETGDAFLLKTVVGEMTQCCTRLEIEGADEAAPPDPLAMPPPLHSSVDRFAFVWLQGKERESFTDRRLRLGVQTLIDQDKIRFQIGLRGSQLKNKDAPESSNRDVAPNVWTGALMYDYPDTSAVLMSYTELRLRTLSVYLLLLSGVLLGAGVNLVTHFLVETVVERRARHSRRGP